MIRVNLPPTVSPGGVPQNTSPMQIAELVRSGRILDHSFRETREKQLQSHSEVIADLLDKQGKDHVEKSVQTAVLLENSWVYEDFEATVRSALPALL